MASQIQGIATRAILAALLLMGLCLGAQAQNKGFVGNKNPRSRKYHVAGCASERRMNQSNRVYFRTPADAEKAGFQPCKICRPERHKAAKKR